MSYNIVPICNYPNDGKHLEVDFTDEPLWSIMDDFCIEITKGKDPFCYDGKETKPHLWYATKGGNVISNKGYKNVEDAVQVALKEAKVYLLEALKSIEEMEASEDE